MKKIITSCLSVLAANFVCGQPLAMDFNNPIQGIFISDDSPRRPVVMERYPNFGECLAGFRHHDYRNVLSMLLNFTNLGSVCQDTRTGWTLRIRWRMNAETATSRYYFIEAKSQRGLADDVEAKPDAPAAAPTPFRGNFLLARQLPGQSITLKVDYPSLEACLRGAEAFDAHRMPLVFYNPLLAQGSVCASQDGWQSYGVVPTRYGMQAVSTLAASLLEALARR